MRAGLYRDCADSRFEHSRGMLAGHWQRVWQDTANAATRLKDPRQVEDWLVEMKDQSRSPRNDSD